MRYVFMVCCLFFVGCDKNDVVKNNRHDTTKENNVRIGPKSDFSPSINLSNGKLELMPSLDFGPRINLD